MNHEVRQTLCVLGAMVPLAEIARETGVSASRLSRLRAGEGGGCTYDTAKAISRFASQLGVNFIASEFRRDDTLDEPDGAVLDEVRDAVVALATASEQFDQAFQSTAALLRGLAAARDGRLAFLSIERELAALSRQRFGVAA